MYKAGFAKTPEAYQDAVVRLFQALDRAEALLNNKTFLVGDRLTEADVRLFVTIVSPGSPCASGRVLNANPFLIQIRFDPAYVGHFKCNIRTIRGGYPNLHGQVLHAYHSPYSSCSLVSLFSLAGCVGCIGRMTLSSLPPTLITSRLTTIGHTYKYVSCLHLIARSKLGGLTGLNKRRSIRPKLYPLAPFHPSSHWKTDFLELSSGYGPRIRRSKRVYESD